ncbi:dihydrofolate reductase family protein [Bhargavaea ullalensis]|uniref:Dihydrofolate reductase n=1 Tax=Bhargavaea ullalensis TaxID=1265685 RepID=A0ABV2G9K3_9BACL
MNRELVFYGAISLDGYLARMDGSLDWLIGTEGEDESGYEEFYETIGTVLMGRKTYDEILGMFPDEFPYAGKACYVFSREKKGFDGQVTFVNEDIEEFVRALKEQEGGRIWMVGGGQALAPLLDAGLVDELVIQITPAVLGGGLPLFSAGVRERRFDLKEVRRFGQFAELRYRKK